MTRRILLLAAFLAAYTSMHGTSLRVFMLGNSLTDDVRYDGFANLATQGNDTLTIGSQRIPGAPVYWLWDNPGSGFNHTPFNYYPNAFANYEWDAITLQPFASRGEELTHARYFLRAVNGKATFGPGAPSVPTGSQATGISTNAVAYIYAIWPTGTVAGWRPDYWLGDDPTAGRSARFAESIVEELRELEPDETVRIIPVGHVFHEIHTQLRAGRIPGITRHPDFMLDGTHLNDRGSYVAGLTFYTTIFQEDPRGRQPVAPYIVTPEQALAIQEATWRVVSRHPLAGLATTTVITNPSLPDVLSGSAYSATLTTAFAEGAVTWSLASGALPAGLTLSTGGIISGTTSEVGIFDLRLRAQDGAGHFDERDYIMFVVSDDPPVITTAALPQAAVGAPYRVVLRYEGGQGEVQWALENGDLPRGLQLGTDGILQGSPVSVEGTYVLTFSATDSLGSSTSTTVALLLTAPEAGTLIAAPAPGAPVVDGFLTEPLWGETIPVQADAATAADPVFSARWDTSALYIGVRVPDQGTPNNGDAVHVFLDGRHDREAVFNVDDRHLVLNRSGEWQERNSRPAGITLVTRQESANWTTEIRIPWDNLQKQVDGQSFTVGLDVAVQLVSGAGDASRTYSWSGTSLVNPAPATMGNLILSAAPLRNTLLVHGGFDNGSVTRPGYPGTASTSYANNGWYANGVPSRPFASIDGTGYGYPQLAIVPYGASPGSAIYQVIHDQKATKGAGYVRFDAKLVSNVIAYRLYGYNGTADSVNTRIGVGTQQHPVSGGTPDATLLSGTLANAEDASWKEMVLPVDFGNGYDYLILVFSAAASAAHVDARLDNFAMGAVAGLTHVTGKTPFVSNPDTLLHANLKGTNPALTVPWKEVYQVHPDLTYSGIRVGAGITRVAGDDGFHYHGNHGSTVSTLDWTFSQNQYLEFELTTTEGTLSLEDAVLQIQVDRLNNGQSAARYALFSSVDGFNSVNDVVGISGALSTAGVQTVAYALPKDPAYRNLTRVSFRLYAYQGQYAGKTVALRGLSLIGAVSVPPRFETAYEGWRSAINWQGSDDTALGDANGDGFANLVVFAFALPSPLETIPAELLPNIYVTKVAENTQLVIPHRRRAGDNGVDYVLEVSTDLQTWGPASLASGLTEVQIDPDLDGDGSAELWEFRLPWGDDHTQFVRLAIAPEME